MKFKLIEKERNKDMKEKILYIIFLINHIFFLLIMFLGSIYGAVQTILSLLSCELSSSNLAKIISFLIFIWMLKHTYQCSKKEIDIIGASTLIEIIKKYHIK